ncbi:EAL domain-containing protein [Pseudolabrys taiwanensis]|uniref:EAL domain-containing protein n=1 Tax=Pseudolabrys taiwanensis TaxID=331696 RepID=A0A346A1G2_9HYPH|nr:EAL domain-containing protein [Pseudolabrys taiwanensis]AXK83009.1 EAL domain-containing protein [Pseudolabrys taiwanensis]
MLASRFFPRKALRDHGAEFPQPDGANARATVFASPASRHANPARLIAAGGFVLTVMIAVATWTLLASLRADQIKETQGNLERQTLMLAEQIDRSMQSIELIQQAVIERVRSLGIVSTRDFEALMVDYETHRRLKDQMRGMPYIDALVLTSPDGKLLNFTRAWPIPQDLGIPQNALPAFEAFKNDPERMVFIGRPLRNPINGAWTIPIARRITGHLGEYLGVTFGTISVSYLEDYFRSVSSNQDHSISLFRRDGTVIARYPVSETVRQRSFANRPLFNDVLPARGFGTLIERGALEDRQLMVSGRNLQHYPMAIVVIKRLDDALTSWRYAAIYIAGAALIITLLIVGGATFMARKFGRNLQAQNRKLDAALNNMSQGLTMFDGAGRLIVYNDRYRDLYKLPPESLKSGIALRDVLQLRAESNTCFVPSHKSVDNYIDELLAKVKEGSPYSFISEIGDGRTIAIVNHPMPGGGWVATHDDITEAKRREESFRLLFDGNPIPMWVHDLGSMRFLAVNEAAVAHYGYSREQFMTMNVFDVRVPEEHDDLTALFRRIDDATSHEQIARHRKADGSVIDIVANMRVLNYEGHRATLVALQDVTSRKAADEQLRRTQNFLDTIIENVPVPILVKEVPPAINDVAKYRYTLINRAAEDLFGISRDYIIGKTPAELFPPEQARFITTNNGATLHSDSPLFQTDHPIDTFLNGRRLATAKSVAVRDGHCRPQYLVTVLEDVTDRRRAEQGIARMAHHDALTDLPNRTAFNAAIESAIERAEKNGEAFVLLSLDLDGFKEANDSYGHAVGDALLREVARRLQLAADQDFAARIGGDEFTVIVTGRRQPETAFVVAERLIASISDDIEIDDRRVSIGATVGGAIYPTDGADARMLMINADMALYRAKAAARGSVVFYEPAMGDQQRERRALQDELRFAIARDELLLHYQPQFKIAGEIVGFEALVRWQSPGRGLVSPAQFIPIAEECGLIMPLGDLVLRHACREAARWHMPLTVAVNISPAQFRNGDLPHQVHTVLMETGLSPARLELEITESVLIDDFSRAISILSRLKALGVRITLDDFGTGYSSLSYLHSFSFDKIKIDRAFIGDLATNRHSKAIVRAVIDLGHSLNVPILAEGVETSEQLALLEQSGCDEVQGYLTGRPEPIAEYGDLTGRIHVRPRGYAAAG